MHVYVAIIFIKRQHDPPIWMITDHRHCTNSLANNRNKLYTCHIGHVCNWCNSECVAWWVILSVKVFECLTLKFLPRSKEDHRATVACSVSHSNNGDQVSVVLPVIFLLLPASVSYQFFPLHFPWHQFHQGLTWNGTWHSITLPLTGLELFQPKTSIFSTHALIWVQFKSVH